mmetsp:Transcript_42918/g.80069  ORF Transcript_42918/g.80069 Transcript_42918/m.80069 type:complete len:247 (-) Transcript_42918:882-1622(-)
MRIHEERLHRPFAFDVLYTSRDEAKCNVVLACLFYSLGHVNLACYAAGFHAASSVHCVTKHAIVRNLLPDHSAHQAPHVQPSSDFDSLPDSAARHYNLLRGFNHLCRYSNCCCCKVRRVVHSPFTASIEQAKGNHVCITHRLHLVSHLSMSVNDVIKPSKQVIQHEHGFCRVDALAHSREALDVREQNDSRIVVFGINKISQTLLHIAWRCIAGRSARSSTRIGSLQTPGLTELVNNVRGHHVIQQ